MAKVALSPNASVAAGSIYAYLRPRLAMDAQIDLKACLAPMRGGKAFGKVKGEIANAIRSVTRGKLAQDADIEDVANFLNAMENIISEPDNSVPIGMGEQNGELPIPEPIPEPEEVNRDDDLAELLMKIREFVKSFADEDRLAQFDQLVGGGALPEESVPEPEDVSANLEESEEDMNRDNRPGMDMGPQMKPAMDAAIAEAQKRERENQRAIFRAIEHIKPTTGTLTAMREMAFDSAEDVYAAGLGHLGIKVEGIHPSAYRAVFDAHAEARRARAVKRDNRMASDALPEGHRPLHERMPHLRNIQVQ